MDVRELSKNKIIMYFLYHISYTNVKYIHDFLFWKIHARLVDGRLFIYFFLARFIEQIYVSVSLAV